MGKNYILWVKYGNQSEVPQPANDWTIRGKYPEDELEKLWLMAKELTTLKDNQTMITQVVDIYPEFQVEDAD